MNIHTRPIPKLILVACAIAALIGTSLVSSVAPARAATQTVSSSNISFGLDLSNGITVTSIHDQVTGHEYITKPAFLFEFAWNNGAPYQSNNGVTVDSSTVTSNAATIRAHATAVPLSFVVTLTAATGGSAVVLTTSVADTGSAPGFLRMVYPKLQHFVTPGSSADMMGAVPQEIGGVANLNDVPSLGMGLNLGIGLPTAMDLMEVADVYDRSGGGGLFFADLDGDTSRGVAPLQFNLSKTEVDGFYTATLKPSETLALPRLAIGVHHSGDWHAAVDYYLAAHNPHWTYTDTPAWLRDAGAIYSPTAGGSGGIYLYQQPQTPLTSRISSFTQLPKLLTEARSVGTSVLYLNDYWNGVKNPQNFPPYYNKGDYTPSSTLGGAHALRAGIAAVHAKGGHVIAYIEPYIIFQYAQIAAEHGTDWAGRDSAGDLDQSYQDYYTMIQPFTPWQDQVVSIAKRLVGRYGFDGVFLDSSGWQMNKNGLQTRAEQVQYTSQEWSQGVLRLVDRVRAAIRTVKPDAVVLSETASGPIAHHLDGGLSADFAWLSGQNDNQIIASPMRYGLPNDDVFSNGRICAQASPCDDEGSGAYSITNVQHLNQLNQIYAAGEGLALSQLELPNATYVKKLVRLRQTYHDALIQGTQTYQPDTGNPAVPAYNYQGVKNQVITVANTTSSTYTGNLALQGAQSGTTWKDMLTGKTFIANGANLAMTVPAASLRVLVRQGRVPTGPPPARFPVTRYNPTLLSANFNDGQLLDHWSVINGTWSNTGAAVQAATTTTGGTISYDTRTGNNFTYSGDITINSGKQAGLSFRLSDNGSQGYDVILSHSDGTVKVTKRPNVVLDSQSMPIKLGQTYHVQVTARGPNIIIRVDGNRLIHINDTSFASGRFGLTSVDSTATYDNLLAVGPNAVG